MDIAFVSTYDAKNIVNWSGLGFYISKSLEDSGNKLTYIGDLKRSVTVDNFLKKIYYTRIRNKKFALERTVAMSKGYSQVVASRLADKKYSCVFSPGSLPIAYLKSSIPKVIFTDATFACFLNYYEPSSSWSGDMIRQGHEIEKQALDSCALAVFSSEWAAESAINYYGTNPSKVKIVPFGANLSHEYSKEDVMQFITEKRSQPFKILFNGIDYSRKGGDTVLAAAIELQNRGVNVELNFVGIPQLPIDDIPSFVINHGFLKKSIPEQKEALEKLYKTCHLLFLPSKAEAFGCVFCEASSFGMPSLSRKTGGVTTAITDGVNGFTLDPSASVNDYVDVITQYFLDKTRYHNLSLSSYKEYKSRLNWKVAGESLTSLIQQL